MTFSWDKICGHTAVEMAAERATDAERAAEREKAVRADAVRRQRLRDAEANADEGEHRSGARLVLFSSLLLKNRSVLSGRVTLTVMPPWTPTPTAIVTRLQLKNRRSNSSKHVAPLDAQRTVLSASAAPQSLVWPPRAPYKYE